MAAGWPDFTGRIVSWFGQGIARPATRCHRDSGRQPRHARARIWFPPGDGYGGSGCGTPYLAWCCWDGRKHALLGAIFFVAGLYIAVQEALESTVTADMVSADAFGISYAALGTVNGTAKFISSAAVGILWAAVSPVFGFGSAAVLMAAGTVALARMQMR